VQIEPHHLGDHPPIGDEGRHPSGGERTTVVGEPFHA
jgi:hypothetical protein